VFGGTTITKIAPQAFIEKYNLVNVVIPHSVTYIGNNAFTGCTRLTNLVVRAETPPTLGADALSATNKLTNIYVPSDSVTKYKTASGWSNFASKIKGY
jgi:hypothetical protein